MSTAHGVVTGRTYYRACVIRTLLERIDVFVYRIPTDAPESDGTIEWSSTTLVLVEAHAGGIHGTGYTYADLATATLLRDTLLPLLIGQDAMAVADLWQRMVHAIRNLGRPGIVSMAISAIDTALWDLKARLLGLPLVRLLGSIRDAIPVYGSGGFTSYSLERMREQTAGWAAMGIRYVKIKIGRDPAKDPARIQAVREAIGNTVELFIDANGAFSAREAVRFAEQIEEFDIHWFEEPVVADDLSGLRFVRDRVPLPMAIAAGEYGYHLSGFYHMLAAGSVDVLQADVTRCGGITEFLRVGALAQAFGIPLSAHTAPSLHCHICCALHNVLHIEYFHDHVRIEQMLFDGIPELKDGLLRPDLSRTGLGIEFKHADAEKFRI